MDAISVASATNARSNLNVIDAVDDAQADGCLLIVVKDATVKGCPVRVRVKVCISNAGNVADANPAIEEPMDAVTTVASFSNP